MTVLLWRVWVVVRVLRGDAYVKRKGKCMKKSMVLGMALALWFVQGCWAIDLVKLSSSASDFAITAIPDMIGLGADITKFIAVAKPIKSKTDSLIKARQAIPATDKTAREINLLEIDLETMNLTTLLTGITAKFLRIVNKITPMIESLVDPAKDPKAAKALGEFRDAFNLITSIMIRINDVNSVTYKKMAEDLKGLKPDAGVEAAKEQVAKPKNEELTIDL